MKPVLESSLRKDISRRHFVAASATAGTIPNSMFANSNDGAIGPVLGHIDESSLFCFIRPPRKGEVRLKLTDLTIGKVAATVSAQAKSENDLCTRFEFKGLIPGHDYHGEFFDTSGQQLFPGAEFRTQTPKEAGEKGGTASKAAGEKDGEYERGGDRGRSARRRHLDSGRLQRHARDQGPTGSDRPRGDLAVLAQLRPLLTRVPQRE